MLLSLLQQQDVLKSAGLRLRIARADDTAFLEAVFAANRAPEFRPLGWDADTLHAFLATQYRMQQQQYGQWFADAEIVIVEDETAPLGQFRLIRASRDIRLIDIALLPEVQNRGTGKLLLRALQAVARAQASGIVLNVKADSPARRLYARLGFEDESFDGFYMAMRWRHCDTEPPGPR